jgi:nucleotide-binding universal stress UspA family protein
MRILVATDFSADADTARALVKGMTLPAGSRVRLVHAIEPITTVGIFAPSALLTISEAADEDARAQVRQSAKYLEMPGRDVDGVVGHGRAADVVIAECGAFEPDLLVVGSRGLGGIATTVLGSVSAELIDRAPCPVLVARVPTLTKAILAEDGSENAAAGARAIAGLPIFAAVTVRVVSVVDVPFPMVFADPTATSTAVEAFRDYESAMPALRKQAGAVAAERAKALESQGFRATWEQREGEAAQELIGAAAELHADCIVVGSRGQTGLRRLMLGSVARSVLFHAPCSVLVAHSPKSAETQSPGHGDGRSPARDREEQAHKTLT